MKKLLFLFVLLLLPLAASADAIEIDGIYYNLKSDAQIAEVVGNPDKYSGTIVIPETVEYEENTYQVTSIGDHAFQSCKSLTAITIPNSVTHIGEQAFAYCSSLTSITIPSGVTSIESRTFYGCSSLTSFNIPNSVKNIYYEAFAQTGWVNDQPDGILYHDHWLLGYKGESPETLAITDGTRGIACWALYGCNSLWSLSIPASVMFITPAAFEGCNLKHIVVDSSNPTFDSRDNCNAIIETATNKLIVASTRTNYIPATVTSIGDGAFSTSGAGSVSIPSSVKSIGKRAFSSWLLYVRSMIENPFPIGDKEYYVNEEEGSYWIKNPFEENTLEEATLFVPVGTKQKYQQTAGWKDFKNIVEIGSMNLNIGNSFYSGKTAYTPGDHECFVSSTNPREVKMECRISIDDDGMLPSVVFGPDGNDYTVTSIHVGNSSVDYTYNKGVIIPKTVTSLIITSDNKFYRCSSIVVEDGNPVYDSREDCNAVIETATNKIVLTSKSTTIPNSVTAIGAGAFSENKELTSITIPNNILCIENYAFAGCSSLTSVTIPNSIEKMEDGIFDGCKNLKEIRSLILYPSDVWLVNSAGGPFRGIPEDVTLYVPEGTKEDYEKEEKWNVFKNIVEMEPDEVPRLKEGDRFDVGLFTYTIEYVSSNQKDVSCQRKAELSGDVVIPESVVAPDGRKFTVRYISNDAFKNCSGIKNVSLPKTLARIGDNAFEGCSGLTTINLPDVIYNLGINDYAFQNCTGLTTLTISKSTTGIAATAFVGCTALSSIVVENGNTVYDSRDNCNAIIVTKKNELFLGCKNTTIPNTVTSIGGFSLSNISGSFSVPNFITTIKGGAFSNSQLSSIVIPASVTSIEGTPFGDCESLTSIVVDEGNTVYDSREDCNAIIATSSNKLVAGCKETVIPNSVTSIGSYAFSNLIELKAIVIPNSVQSIERNAFENCRGLTDITIPYSVRSIANYAFLGCRNIKDVYSQIEYPSALNKYVFQAISRATLHVPAGTKSRYQNLEGWNVFKNIVDPADSWLKESDTFVVDDVPYVVMDCGDWPEVFAGDMNYQSSATSVVIPSTVVGPDGVTYHVSSFSTDAFKGFANLMSVTIPKSIETIYGTPFTDCQNLVSIVVEDGNPVYDSREGCNAIIETATNILRYGCKNSTIPQSVTTIGWDAFAMCTGLTSFTIPDYVTKIEDHAFYGCSGLTTLTLPNAQATYGYDVFEGCTALTTLTIPSLVTSINGWMFGNCLNIKNLFVLAENPPMGGNTFNFIYEQATLFVPAGTKAKYEAADGWKEFKNIVEIDLTTVNGIDISGTKANVYDISGRKVGNGQLKKGVYIVGGKKVAIK